MKDIGKISIVMPCWKAEKYISDIVNDVTKQTYENWELIIVSNGSGQAPQLEVIRPFLSADNRLRVISTEIPGVSNARNLGMASATGDWLTFVDADDRIKDCYLESLAEGTTDSVDIVIGGYTAHLVESNSYSNIQASKVSGIDKNFIEMFDMIKKVAWGKLFRISTLRNGGGI
ncbi:MAG: glycosyltransferase family 2 protein [Barnesiella sp.]|nr:glycosyltransferase family 2 protein [Barnesiella sp.]